MNNYMGTANASQAAKNKSGGKAAYIVCAVIVILLCALLALMLVDPLGYGDPQTEDESTAVTSVFTASSEGEPLEPATIPDALTESEENTFSNVSASSALLADDGEASAIDELTENYDLGGSVVTQDDDSEGYEEFEESEFFDDSE